MSTGGWGSRRVTSAPAFNHLPPPRNGHDTALSEIAIDGGAQAPEQRPAPRIFDGVFVLGLEERIVSKYRQQYRQ